MRTDRVLPLAAGVALTAAVTAGCGSSSVSASTYVHTVCSGISTYQSAVANGPATKLQSDVQAAGQSGDFTTVKNDLSGAVAAAQTALSRAKDQAAKAGKPSVSNGSTIRSTVNRSLTQAVSDLSAAKAKIDALNPADKSGFASSLAAVSTQLNSAGNTVQSTLTGPNGLGSPALKHYLGSDHSCTSLTASPGATPSAG
jgi:hypothetical protein